MVFCVEFMSVCHCNLLSCRQQYNIIENFSRMPSVAIWQHPFFSVSYDKIQSVFFCGGLKLTSQSLWKVRYVAIWQLRSNSRLFLYLLSSPLTCSRSKSQKWQIIMSFIIITYINIVSYEVLPHRSESIWISTKTLSCTTIPNLIGNANNVPWLFSI